MTPDALADLKLVASGKVREMYEIEDDLLMVASDRISAYDVVLPTPIPDKGAVLTRMSVFWFETTGDICPNHMITAEVPPEAEGRGLRVKKLQMYPVECVVRGYITGSGWKEYGKTGEVCGIKLPEGLQESQKLPEPIFTPATKAEVGDHDENISFERAVETIGDRALMEGLRDTSIALYEHAAAHAAGARDHHRRHEVRVRRLPWRRDRPGRRGLDPRLVALLARRRLRGGPRTVVVRQAVRARLARRSGWDHSPPGPELPDEIVQGTRAKYVEAYERITGSRLLAHNWLASSPP